MKAAGLVDSLEACWDFFLARLRRNLHLVLCCSPVGDRLRLRARAFPALVAATACDWFHPWPREALVSGARAAGVGG